MGSVDGGGAQLRPASSAACGRADRGVQRRVPRGAWGRKGGGHAGGGTQRKGATDVQHAAARMERSWPWLA